AKITRITTQKNNHGRYNIFLDHGSGEEFGFGVDEDVLVTFALAKGKEVDEKELKAVIFEDDVKKAFNQAINFLSYRMRSAKEIKDYLLKKDMHVEAIPIVIERLQYQRYVDDREFAKM